MTAAWSPAELQEINAARELEIASRRADGTLRRWVPIWAVSTGGLVYVRTWYRRRDRLVEGPAVSGLRKRYSLKPLPAIPGTHCGPPAEAGTRSLSGDASDCSAVRCSVQYRAWPFRGPGRLCDIRALS